MKMMRKTGVVSALVLLCASMQAQTVAPVPASQGVQASGAAVSAAGVSGAAVSGQQGVALDWLVAVVNGDVILQSDVNEELRFQAFQPLRTGNTTRQQSVERLINRTLILQQARLQPEKDITDQQVDEQLNALRKEIPDCKQYQCETETGWLAFIKAQDFTLAELRTRWRERMEVLRFIEERFRSGTTVADEEVRNYYDKTLLPQYAQRHAQAPKLEVIAARIQEILLQQQVGNLLADWLKSLRAQGTVRTIETASTPETDAAQPNKGAR